VGFQAVWPCAIRLVLVTAKTEIHRIVVSLSNFFIESPNFGPVTGKSNAPNTLTRHYCSKYIFETPLGDYS